VERENRRGTLKLNEESKVGESTSSANNRLKKIRTKWRLPLPTELSQVGWQREHSRYTQRIAGKSHKLKLNTFKSTSIIGSMRIPNEGAIFKYNTYLYRNIFVSKILHSVLSFFIISNSFNRPLFGRINYWL